MVLFHIQKSLTFQQLERSTSSCGHVRNLVFGAPLGAAGGSVASSNDRDGPTGGRIDYGVHHQLGTRGELLKLKYAARATERERKTRKLVK